MEEEVEVSIHLAENFLLKMFDKSGKFSTFDDLRYHTYLQGKKKPFADYLPSRASMRLHILRAFFIVYTQKNILSNGQILDYNNFGFEDDRDVLIPQRVNLIYPPECELVPQCNCAKCSRKSYGCTVMDLSCCRFCNCKIKGPCKNPHN